uniref:Uncharacterized protein n=1 Tax=candidate division WOR-3 bacterium TaxID=2052148 RepID=A0A7V3UZF9_UNCW3
MVSTVRKRVGFRVYEGVGLRVGKTVKSGLGLTVCAGVVMMAGIMVLGMVKTGVRRMVVISVESWVAG